MLSARTLRLPLATSVRFSPVARAAFAVPVATFRTDAAAEEPKSRAHGSYHWSFERSLSLVSLPLIGSAAVFGPIPAVDFLMGFVIPAHCYFGFESMIVDYLPARRVGAFYSIMIWTTRIITALAMYGCYIINTTDVGITALTKRIWTGKE
ncbi:hypothetical protein HK105_206975 [Polyrhizophydium stewartii]|uniref:Succinate dehydrogenase [ubiquinone] cytochrome b small subunit n=1 Tax=Polyrhizophydium stewartii TaxID=2732419 RepID=A0ABR4N1X0_9FUNG|nr:membrane anchor subunit of succinate dehydrogenase, Sdh4 [Polyrhizophydium stewartii]